MNQEEETNQKISMEELLKSESEFSNRLYHREIVKAKVVQITGDNILVDINEKKEGVVPLSEFEDEKVPRAGSTIDVILVKKGGEKYYAVLSHRMAREQAALKICEKCFNGKEKIKGRISKAVKGGYIVDISGLNAFMPLSLSELGGAHKHYLPKNAKIKAYVTDMDPKAKKVIISRRRVLEENESERKKKVFEQIKPGIVTRAVVSKTVKDGMFIRYQGIEGFVRKEDVSWKNQEEEIKKYKRGQRIKCRILSMDPEKQKINFGIKQLTPNPLDVLRRKFIKKTVRGVVESADEKGAKVKIGGNVTGYISGHDYGFDGKPSENSTVKAVVFGINPDTYELQLSMKRQEIIEEKKRVQKYLKDSPNLTLGQILGNIPKSEE